MFLNLLLHGLVQSCRLSNIAGGPQTETIRLGLISEGTNTWPLYAAQHLGLFKRSALHVEVTVVGSSVKQQEELRRGDFDIGFQQADHVVRAVEQGSDLFIFASQGHAPDVTLVATPDVTQIAALRGRPIAVDGARTGYALLLRRLLVQHGFSESDIVFREIGGSQERFDMVRNGGAAAVMLNPPFDASLIASGYSKLARMSEAFPDYPGSVMAARKSWAQSHRRELSAFLSALKDAYAWLRKPENQNAALAMLPSRLAIAPRAAEAALAGFTVRQGPQVTEDGLRQVIDTVWASESYAGDKAPPAKYMDLAYAEPPP